MRNMCWVAVDTETSGINVPIYAVEIAAQRMRGWEPEGESFRVLLNHDVPIESTAEALHGYSRTYLRKHGMDPVRAHALFADYAGDCPLVAYNLGFDWKRVLVPEYNRLGIKGGGREGFCALTLARRVVHETENYRLDTMKNHFQLGSGRAHKAMNDVETMVKLMSQVMAPRLEKAGVCEWEDVARFSRRSPIAHCRKVILGEETASIPQFCGTRYAREVISGEKEHRNTLPRRQGYGAQVRPNKKETHLVATRPLDSLLPQSNRVEPPAYSPVPWREKISLEEISGGIEESEAKPFYVRHYPAMLPRNAAGQAEEGLQGSRPEVKQLYVVHYEGWINELFEICRGILAVEVIGDAEIRVLSEWLENCPCTHLYPVNVVVRLLERVDAEVLRRELENILPA